MKICSSLILPLSALDCLFPGKQGQAEDKTGGIEIVQMQPAVMPLICVVAKVGSNGNAFDWERPRAQAGSLTICEGGELGAEDAHHRPSLWGERVGSVLVTRIREIIAGCSIGDS